MCCELWGHWDDFMDEPIYLVCAIGSTVFLVVPYISNLRAATRIKRIIKENDAAVAWYANHTISLSTSVHPDNFRNF